LWGTPPAPGAAPDWHTGPPGVVGNPFFGGAGPFMGHNTPGSPASHSGGGA
jgi:hypothetical protein